MTFTITKCNHSLVLTTLMASLCLATNSHAAGFYLSEVGTPASVGTAGVGTTTNNRFADAAWTNPAAMTGIETDHVLGGMQLVIPSMKFDSSSATTVSGNDGGNAGNTAVIPSFFATKKLSERLHAGFALTVPIGGGFDFGDNFAGRYGVIDLDLAGMTLSGSLGYKINDKVSVGGGLSMIYTTFEQTLALRTAGPDGKVKMRDLDDWGYQPYAGVTWAISDTIFLGAVYRAEAEVDLKGDLKISNPAGPIPPANKVKVGWDNPQTFEAGLRVKLSDERTMMFNAGWQDWSAFSENAIDLSGGIINPILILDRKFQDTWHIGAAVIEEIDNSIYSLGISYESSPVEDKDRTIDLPFDESLRISAAWAWKGTENLDFSLGGTLAYMGDAKIENQNTQGLNFDGEFDTNLLLFLSGTVKYTF
jgi:long-chain fatty acid transport protein